MLSHCANPSCGARFHYLGAGKMFQVEFDEKGEPYPPGPRLVEAHKTARLERFWLCEKCACTLTLSYERGRGVIAVPILSARPAAS